MLERGAPEGREGRERSRLNVGKREILADIMAVDLADYGVPPRDAVA